MSIIPYAHFRPAKPEVLLWCLWNGIAVYWYFRFMRLCTNGGIVITFRYDIMELIRGEFTQVSGMI